MTRHMTLITYAMILTPFKAIYILRGDILSSSRFFIHSLNLGFFVQIFDPDVVGFDRKRIRRIQSSVTIWPTWKTISFYRNYKIFLLFSYFHFFGI